MTTTDPDLAPDERHCPWCAEVIKRRAVRCRWCQADLAEATPPPGTNAAGSDPDPASRAPEPAPADRSPTSSRTFTLVVVGLAVLAVLLAFLVGRVLWLDGADREAADARLELVRGASADERAEAAVEDVEGMVIASAGAKSAGLTAATEAVQQVLSYSHETLDADVAGAEQRLAGDQLEQYRATMESIRDETLTNQVQVRATVVAASVVSATAHEVKALLFVNQTTTRKDLDAPRLDLNRVLVTLRRDGAAWKVTAIAAL